MGSEILPSTFPGTVWKEVPTGVSQWPGPSGSFRATCSFFFFFLRFFIELKQQHTIFFGNYKVNIEISEKLIL